MNYSTTQRLAAEALGTALLVAAVVGSGIMAEKLAGGSSALALLCNTIPTGAILYVLIITLGEVSGAHFNPVVSTVFGVRGELPWSLVGPYVLAQVVGGVAGTLLAHLMFDLPLFQLSATARTGVAQWVSEGVATFALLFAILGTIRARPEAVPVAVALVIVSAYWFTASTSFANPAVSIARTLSNTFAGIAPGDVPAFVVAQSCGGGLALLVAHAGFGWTADPEEEPTLAPPLNPEPPAKARQLRGG